MVVNLYFISSRKIVLDQSFSLHEHINRAPWNLDLSNSRKFKRPVCIFNDNKQVPVTSPFSVTLRVPLYKFFSDQCPVALLCMQNGVVYKLDASRLPKTLAVSTSNAFPPPHFAKQVDSISFCKF